MSVYKKEKPEYLRKALQSVYSQTLGCDEVILIKDGLLGKELDRVVDEFCEKYPNLKPYALEKNVQLGRALAIGVGLCEHEYVARMDTDDIAVPERLKLQYDFLEQHPDIAVVGGDIAEFVSENKVVRVKNMPTDHEKIYNYGKYRNPLNHMTVMFRKSAVLASGNYCYFPLLEDYHLWSRMLAKGYQLGNISKILVHARIDKNFSSKRGGWSYFKRYTKLRCMQHQMGYTNGAELLLGIVCSFLMTMQPKRMRDFVYKYVLRR